MKAIVYADARSVDPIRLSEIEKPVPADNEVLLQVCASSVNPADWRVATAPSFLRRLLSKAGAPGIDVAGVIDVAGPGVTQFKPGDEVFGATRGAFAEYARAVASRLVRKPPNVTFEEAASIPVAGLTAWQALHEHGHIQAGHTVLINGAAGGVGTFAVQLAKVAGAHVTAVCSARNVEMVRSLGADAVIDYSQQDFTSTAQRFDIFLDNVGNRPVLACRRLLTPNGRYIAAGAPKDWGPVAVRMFAVLGLSIVSRRVTFFIGRMRVADAAAIADLMAAGKVRAVIDRTYPLSEVPDAFRYAETGHARAKVVIKVRP